MLNAVSKNVIIYDKETGIPSIMVKLSKPEGADVPPIFTIKGRTVDAIYISKYPNTIINGRAYSLPLVDPKTNIDFDTAVQACRAKGSGWHLMTAVEWEYLLNQCRSNGKMPHGNTNYGSDYYNKEEHGNKKGSDYGRTLTGSGPVSWCHDYTPDGVTDLNGNVWEWLAGMRIINGIIEYMPNNDAAAEDCDLSRDSKDWQQIKTERGTVRANVDSWDITITDLPESEDYEPDCDGVRVDNLAVELEEIPQALRDLGIVPEMRLDEEKKTYVYFDATEGEWLPLRGSAFRNTSHSGPSALNLYPTRSDSNDGIGFRSAFYEVNGKLVTE